MGREARTGVHRSPISKFIPADPLIDPRQDRCEMESMCLDRQVFMLQTGTAPRSIRQAIALDSGIGVSPRVRSFVTWYRPQQEQALTNA